MNNQDEIINQYKDYMSQIEEQFPLSEEKIKSEHKKIKTQIFSKINTNKIPSNLDKKLESEFLNYLNKNDCAYYSKLNLFFANFKQKDVFPDELSPITKNLYSNILFRLNNDCFFISFSIDKISSGFPIIFNFKSFIIEVYIRYFSEE